MSMHILPKLQHLLKCDSQCATCNGLPGPILYLSGRTGGVSVNRQLLKVRVDEGKPLHGVPCTNDQSSEYVGCLVNMGKISPLQ